MNSNSHIYYIHLYGYNNTYIHVRIFVLNLYVFKSRKVQPHLSQFNQCSLYVTIEIKKTLTKVKI